MLTVVAAGGGDCSPRVRSNRSTNTAAAEQDPPGVSRSAYDQSIDARNVRWRCTVLGEHHRSVQAESSKLLAISFMTTTAIAPRPTRIARHTV